MDVGPEHCEVAGLLDDSDVAGGRSVPDRAPPVGRGCLREASL